MSDERMPAQPRVTPPETTVPEATVPETTVPETTVPETTVPEATVPEATPPAAVVAPRTDVPSDDVAAAVATASLPGAHRGGFRRELTEPVPIMATVHNEPEWSPDPGSPSAVVPLPRSAPWGLTFGILGLIVSFLVGWGFLIGLVGTGLAIVALRRPWESREVAVWALCLSVVSVLYSAGWLWWASTQGPLFG